MGVDVLLLLWLLFLFLVGFFCLFLGMSLGLLLLSVVVLWLLIRLVFDV